MVIGLLVHGMDYFLFAYFLKHEAYYVSEYKIFHFWPPLLNRIMWFYLSSWTQISSGPWIHLEPEKGWTFCFVSCSWRRSGQRSSPSRLDSEIYQETWKLSPQNLSDPGKDSYDHMLETMKHFTWISIFYINKKILKKEWKSSEIHLGLTVSC